MEVMLWAFGALVAIVAIIIGVAAWIVFVRDRGEPNRGVKMRTRPGKMAKSDPRRGVPRSR